MPPRRAPVANTNTDIAAILAQLVTQLTQANSATNGTMVEMVVIVVMLERNRGVDVAMALPWDEVKRLMADEFCPRNEVKKLEAEFWDLAQDSGENLAYTTRFHELSLLVPHMVTPLSRCIEKYIGGLPRQIQDTVLGRNPATLEDAIRLSATLTDNHVKAGCVHLSRPNHALWLVSVVSWNHRHDRAWPRHGRA
ncbi:hypothetical protein L1987_69186 [Smallanthus sonchifolius]|uniref:Uncharacterized protein n=1 Tax=Smallanthus sonchifolius TaxID=185202 RepID=A0ACB9B578_9ASTR|nr:hypothetical protein L1987_69186 [Smallanthus sonchifolius]